MYTLAYISAYHAFCYGCTGYMKNGQVADSTGHFIAADLHYWHLGDQIEICLESGPVVFTVADTGGDIKGKWRFDILMASEEEALAWGVQHLHVSPLGS
jgi:3D (Asp-Asp-Asp) domain-containing protein